MNAPFRSQIFEIFFASGGKGALTPPTKILRTYVPVGAVGGRDGSVGRGWRDTASRAGIARGGRTDSVHRVGLRPAPARYAGTRPPALQRPARGTPTLILSSGWWRGTVVERRSLTGELSLSCARPAADG